MKAQILRTECYRHYRLNVSSCTSIFIRWLEWNLRFLDCHGMHTSIGTHVRERDSNRTFIMKHEISCRKGSRSWHCEAYNLLRASFLKLNLYGIQFSHTGTTFWHLDDFAICLSKIKKLFHSRKDVSTSFSCLRLVKDYFCFKVLTNSFFFTRHILRPID